MMSTLTTDSVADAGLSPLADDDLRLMLMIRHFERKLLSLFELGELNGTTHTSLGQEYIPVAMSALLDMRDFVFSNHRGHGHYAGRQRGVAGDLLVPNIVLLPADIRPGRLGQARPLPGQLR